MRGTKRHHGPGKWRVQVYAGTDATELPTALKLHRSVRAMFKPGRLLADDPGQPRPRGHAAEGLPPVDPPSPERLAAGLAALDDVDPHLATFAEVAS